MNDRYLRVGAETTQIDDENSDIYRRDKEADEALLLSA